ncbi:MAG TPA: hypothetical protein VF153_06255 [Candidatus Limnocylindria bacterium]
MPLLRLLLVAVAIVGTVAISVAVDQSSHSVSDTLYGAAGPVLLLWLVVAALLLLPRLRRS